MRRIKRRRRTSLGSSRRSSSGGQRWRTVQWSSPSLRPDKAADSESSYQTDALLAREFMFPDSQHMPPHGVQRAVDAAVAGELEALESGVGLGSGQLAAHLENQRMA